MKKKLFSIFLIIIVLLGSVIPVNAADYVDTPDYFWNNYVQKFTKIMNDDFGDVLNLDIGHDSRHLIVSHKGYHAFEDDDSWTFEFSYSDGILELKSFTDGYYSSSIISTLMQVYIEIHGYSTDLLLYLDDNLDNDFTLAKDGIEYSTSSYYTDEQIEEMIKGCEEVGYGCGFPDPIVFDTFKLDLLNKLKNYDNSVQVVHKFSTTTEQFDTIKDAVLKFTCEGEFELFDKVYIDGAEVASTNYKVSKGSTIIEFNKDYAKKLSVGNHVLKLTYTDGSYASTSFKVVQNIENPKTSYGFGYKELALIIVLLTGAFVVVKKTRFN